MLSFFRSLWPFVRPHRNRLILGLAFGVVYAATSGALMFLVKLVVNLVFPESGHFSLAEQIQKAPEFLHPLTEPLLRWVPELKSPESKIGKVLLVCTLPLLMLIRAVAGYLNVYLTN